MANDWKDESHKVARVTQNSTNTTIQFAEYSSYGICLALEGEHGLVNHCGGSAPGRLVVTGLLSEVDTPGEWWYDSHAKNLYIYPPPDVKGKPAAEQR